MTIQGDPHYSLLFAAELMDRVENFLGRECPRTRGGAQYDSSAGGNRPIYESDDEPQVDFDEIETGRQYEGQRTPHCPARGLAATEPAGTEPSRTEPQRSPAQPGTSTSRTRNCCTFSWTCFCRLCHTKWPGSSHSEHAAATSSKEACFPELPCP